MGWTGGQGDGWTRGQVDKGTWGVNEYLLPSALADGLRDNYTNQGLQPH
jgi:hypothetical protein